MYSLCTDKLCRFLPWFLEAIPSEGCAKGGAGAYNNAIQKDAADPTGARHQRWNVVCKVSASLQHLQLSGLQAVPRSNPTSAQLLVRELVF
jgi:hypothetical protein